MLKITKTTTILTVLLLLFVLNTTSNAALDDESLVLYLSFEEGSGDKAADGSTYNHDGDLISNLSWVDGQFGGTALEFDGSKGQHVKIPITDTLQLREKFTIAFWVKRGDSQVAEWNYMVAAGELVWATIFNNNSQKTYLWSKVPGWQQKAITTENQPQDWVHITVTHDIDSEVVIYYDGKKTGGGTKPPAIIEIGGSIMVGARHPGREFFTGIIDEVYLFNRILPEAEITDIIAGDFASVEPANKLATKWGAIKANRHQ